MALTSAAPLRVVLCSNAFKECLSAVDACRAMEAGVRRCAPTAQCRVIPLADGGDNSLDALVGTRGRVVRCEAAVEDPLGRPCTGVYGVIDEGRTLVVEMAKVSGLALLRDAEKDPRRTSTYGTGEVIRRALDAHPAAGRVVLCIGGSATHDIGLGLAAALGYSFTSATGEPIPRPTGGNLADIHHVHTNAVDPRLRSIDFVVACDVVNPLLGPEGAATVFAPQKGAGPDVVPLLEGGGREVVDVLAREDTRRAITAAVGTPGEVFANMSTLEGGGAAGGLGLGCRVFLNATFAPGFEVVSDAVGLDDALASADLAITGEGALDAQTAAGKVPHGVSRMCMRRGVPLVALGGSVALDHSLEAGVFSICNAPMTLRAAMEPENARALLAAAAHNVTRVFLAGRGAGGRV